MGLLAEIEFGSLFSYISRSEGKILQSEAHSFVYPTLKQDKLMPSEGVTASEFVAQEAKNAFDLPFTDFFGEDVYLIPAPSSSKKRPGDLRLTLNIANALSKQGFGSVIDCLTRIERVDKAAFGSGREYRLVKRHFETISVTESLIVPAKIVIVDDVVTSGATLLACASRIKEVWPEAFVLGFAAVRTISPPGTEFVNRKDPCRGKIVLEGDYTNRTP